VLGRDLDVEHARDHQQRDEDDGRERGQQQPVDVVETREALRRPGADAGEADEAAGGKGTGEKCLKRKDGPGVRRHAMFT
jgi:hypothetical protein